MEDQLNNLEEKLSEKLDEKLEVDNLGDGSESDDPGFTMIGVPKKKKKEEGPQKGGAGNPEVLGLDDDFNFDGLELQH